MLSGNFHVPPGGVGVDFLNFLNGLIEKFRYAQLIAHDLLMKMIYHMYILYVKVGEKKEKYGAHFFKIF